MNSIRKSKCLDVLEMVSMNHQNTLLALNHWSSSTKESYFVGNDECNVNKLWSNTKHVGESHFDCYLPF